ncbi:uncharacterized protein LOC143257092 isoform X2 [Tachypleus tridentatus]|uniref:uncharacterized protein LOC143257092 isoform X2 n=2 Tax=Tachypleus tridentatus TaxID=6853 RepID=UPI003FD3A28C
MFYSKEILQKRGGKFSVIWLAATEPSLLSRKDFISVGISKSCSDILDYIFGNLPAIRPGGKKPRLSLCLSSKLMYGVTFVYKKQNDYLFDDVKKFQDRLKLIKMILEGPDTNVLPPRKVSVTLKDPLEMFVDIEFGRLLPLTASPPEPTYKFLVVLSPRSPEPQVSEISVISRKRTAEEELEDHMPVLHTVRPSEITIVEPPPFPPLEEVEVPGAKELPLLEMDEYEKEVFEPLSDIPEQPFPLIPSPPPITIPSPKKDVQIPKETTPTVIKEPPKPTRPVKLSLPLEEGLDVTPAVKPARVRARKRREPSSEFELEELEPVVRKPKRPRRRLYDLNITISREEMLSGMATANERLTHPIELPLLQETPQEMFAHPGSYIGSEILLRFWKNLKTQTEPKDPAAPGMYVVREESSPSEESEQGIPRTEEPVGLEEPAISLEEMALEVERLRERSAQEDSSLLKTPASLQDITMITEAQEISGKTPTEKISPEALAEVPFMLPIAEEIEPQLQKEPEPICEVSPPRTPPPPSPSPEHSPSPSKDKLKLMLQQAMRMTKTPGVITFKALISPKIHSRLYASNTLYKLLELHKIGVVHLRQEFPYGDIFIIQF